MPDASDMEKVQRVIAESEEVVAECDRLNDHTDHEEGCVYDSIKREMWNDKGHAWGTGVDLGTKDTGVDAPYIWPSKSGRRGRLHLCQECGVPQPYGEFDRTPGSRIFTGRVCNSCIDKRHSVRVRIRRTNNVPRHSGLGPSAGRSPR
jgi:hypothetical protein